MRIDLLSIYSEKQIKIEKEEREKMKI